MTEGGKQRSLIPTIGSGGATTTLTTAAAAAVASAAYYYWHSNRSLSPQQQFHVDYGTFPPLPLALRMISKLPDQLRLKLLIKVLKPKLPQDGIDVLNDDKEIQAAIVAAAAANDDDSINQQAIETFRQSYSPYHITELVPNKLWKVTYEFLLDLNLSNSMKDLFGIDLTDQQAVVAQAPDHLKEQLRQDFEMVEAYKKLPTKLHQLMTYGANSCQNMFIIKLTETTKETDDDDNNDVLLLYNPCRMHTEMVNFLNNLGTVKFFVSGASSHTNQLPHVMSKFPKAKLICASAAALKCQAAGMTKHADYLYDISKDKPSTYDDRLLPGQGTLEDAKEAFQDFQDITLHYIKGEAATQPLVIVAHGVLLECDLLYAPLPSVWNDFISSDSILASWGRIFYYGAIKPSPNGHLPKYRYMMMDSSMVFTSKCMLDVPINENCLQMAQSLRTLLNEIPFQKASGAHSTYGKLSQCYDREEFRQALNETWNWLDGKSLLREDEEK